MRSPLHAPLPRPKGFTIIELLVVILIIGILSAIAIPTTLNQINRVREAEAKHNIGAVNRAQQRYFHLNETFTANLGDLDIGLSVITENYSYQILVGDGIVTTQALPARNLKPYVGVVAIVSVSGVPQFRSVLCEATSPDIDGNQEGAIDGSSVVCPARFEPLR